MSKSVSGPLLAAAAAALCLGGCAAPARPASAPRADSAAHVLVVVNVESDASKTIGDYYARQRHLPAENIVRLRTRAVEEAPEEAVESEILRPVRAAIKASANRIDYVVLTKGIPIRIRQDGNSVDGRLAAMDLPSREVLPNVRVTPNPFFAAAEHFDASRFGIVLVTRLDGYETADCLRLVDDSLAAKPEKGPFFFGPAANRAARDSGLLQGDMLAAAGSMKSRSYRVDVGKPGTFGAPPGPLAGYCSWGSNDSSYKRDAYLNLRFKPGALAETFVSTSGRTFSNRNAPGQSLVADLIAQGVTGVKGYVSEPFMFALAHPDILWDRYTSGYNLAESFYMASRVLGWKDVVIGDPLCAPYRK